MLLPTCTVTATLTDQSGAPATDAVVIATLNQLERYEGLVVPRRVKVFADEQGRCVLHLFPNALGSSGSQYSIEIRVGGAVVVKATATVPNTDTADLYSILDLSAPPALSDAQVAQLAGEAAAGEAASSEANAATSETNAASSASAAARSETNAAASSGAAAASETNAAASADAASTKASEAALSEAAAAASATNAAASAIAASADAGDADASQHAAAVSAGEAAASAATATAAANQIDETLLALSINLVQTQSIVVPLAGFT